jgi:hypothetical protein
LYRHKQRKYQWFINKRLPGSPGLTALGFPVKVKSITFAAT